METTRVYLLKTKDEDIKQLSFLDEITGMKFIPRIGESILHYMELDLLFILLKMNAIAVVCEKIMNV